MPLARKALGGKIYGILQVPSARQGLHKKTCGLKQVLFQWTIPHALQVFPVSVSKRCFVYICHCVLKFYQVKHPWFYQGSFISEMEWAPFKSLLFWNANDSVAKLMISITSGVSLWDVSLWDRPCY